MPHPYPFYFSICIISLQSTHSRSLSLSTLQPGGGGAVPLEIPSERRERRACAQIRTRERWRTGPERPDPHWAPPHLLVGLPKLFLFFCQKFFLINFLIDFSQKKLQNLILNFCLPNIFIFQTFSKTFFHNFITNVCHKLFGIFFAFQNFLVKFSFFSFFY